MSGPTKTPDDGGGGIAIDPGELSSLADTLSRASRDISTARDTLNAAWKSSSHAFGSTPGAAALSSFFSTWIPGVDSISSYEYYLAGYTQDVANAFGATDRALAYRPTGEYSHAQDPKVVQDPPRKSSPFGGGSTMA